MDKKNNFNIPNLLTTLRLLCIPVMAYFIYSGGKTDSGNNLIAFILFVAIWTTDLLDGYIARKFNQVTDFGKLFDPFVDKLFHVVTALMMSVVGRLPYWVPAIIFVKETLMVIGGAILFTKYKLVVYSKWYGKIATALFVIAFCVLFFIPENHVHISGYLFLPAIIMSLFSYVKYFADNVIQLFSNKKKNRLSEEPSSPPEGEQIVEGKEDESDEKAFG